MARQDLKPDQKNPNPLKLVVNGCAGRMGRALLRVAHAHRDCVLVGGLEQAGTEAIGQDLGRLMGVADCGLQIFDNATDLFANVAGTDGVDAIVDFTTPTATTALADSAAQAGIIHVIGTTGFTAAQETKIKAASEKITIIKSGNMSLGVNLLAGLVAQATARLQADWDIEILDMHHRHKTDAPSGTALLLGEAAAKGRGQTIDEAAIYTRKGHIGERESGKIGFAVLRGGTMVGEHQVILAGEEERLVLSHVAENRDIFARGAIAAALWGRTQKPGLFSMQDVLGL